MILGVVIEHARNGVFLAFSGLIIIYFTLGTKVIMPPIENGGAYSDRFFRPSVCLSVRWNTAYSFHRIFLKLGMH